MPNSSAGLYYEERGTGSDVLLWIHGFGSSTRGANGVVEEFDDYRFPALAAAAHELMDELGIPGIR